MPDLCVVFENKSVDDTFYELKDLPTQFEFLDRLAEENGLAPLSSFCHWNSDEDPSEYHCSEDALKTVHHFLEVLPETPAEDFDYNHADYKNGTLAELNDLKRMLDRAVELKSAVVFAVIE